MKQLNFIATLLITFFSLTTVFAQQSQPLADTDKNRIQEKADSLLQQHIVLQEMVGVSAGIYYQGETIWKGGAGYRDLENQLPATGEMRHRIASITKPMTAIAIMQLVEKGKIDLDELLSEISHAD